jgi:hypothetical protein
MGVESKLKAAKPAANRAEYPNGDRKLYDKDACPSGCDEYVWHLALLFKEGLEGMNASGGAKLPVLYTEIYEKISSDKDLTTLLDRATVCTSSKGEGGIELITAANIHKVKVKEDIITAIDNKLLIVERIITAYFNNYYSNYPPDIDNFISSFNDLKAAIVQKEFFRLLKIYGTKVPATTREPRELSEKEREALDIRNRKPYTDEEREELFAKFKRMAKEEYGIGEG